MQPRSRWLHDMLAAVARFLLKVGGWTPIGGIPDAPKAVIIAAPHTSNWDAYWAMVYKIAIGVEIHFFAKHTLFWFPLGTLLRSLGGIPLDRSQAASAVDKAVEMFGTHKSFYFGLAPEGTRSLTGGWKTGFYRIARGASVPVYLGVIDYRNKKIGMQKRVLLSGNVDEDMEICANHYAEIEGRHPENASPVRFER